MFKREKETVRLWQYEMLQKRYNKLKREFDEVSAANKKLQNDLELANAQMECLERAQIDFAEALKQARRVKDQYTNAYEDLKIIRNKYAADVEKLIKQIK